ncbi:heparinase II/III family protein [Kocuria palustris]|uniref:heparinase II/III domain-containing protein n=1 Tax=Kocuria palustris TaxID=71999 RepID=UPI0011A30B63|nr:heparinase II/III family protein [Kocuria palustris]
MSTPALDQGLPTQLRPSFEKRMIRDADWSRDADGPLRIRLFTGAEIVVGGSPGLDFAQEFPNQKGSSLMWLYALEPLRRAGEVVRQGHPEDLPSLVEGWKAAVEHLGGPGGTQRWTDLPSMDHACATRIRTCLEAGELIEDEEVRRGIREIADQTVAWVLDDANYRPNNHGLMSSIALLLWHVAVERVEGGSTALDTALTRIVELAEEAFDDRGMCNENTVGYHNFNLHCYREVLRIQDAEQISETIDEQLRPILDRAREALELTMLQDDTIPTIGDSGKYRPAVVHSRNRSSAFPDSGLAVYKSERLYVSLVGGARTEVHKHADDTALTVHRDGAPLLVDAGSYLYDKTDPYRKAMESSLGHCVIAPQDHDGELRQFFVRAHPDYGAAFTHHEVPAEGDCRMGVEAWLPDRFRIARSVAVLDDRWIVVKDEVRLLALARSSAARQRWLFGPDLHLHRLSADSWEASRDGAPAVSLHLVGSAESETYRGEEFGGHRGWASEHYGTKHPVSGLDRIGRGSVQVHRALIDAADAPALSLAEVPAEVLEVLHS